MCRVYVDGRLNVGGRLDTYAANSGIIYTNVDLRRDVSVLREIRSGVGVHGVFADCVGRFHEYGESPDEYYRYFFFSKINRFKIMSIILLRRYR